MEGIQLSRDSTQFIANWFPNYAVTCSNPKSYAQHKFQPLTLLGSFAFFISAYNSSTHENITHQKHRRKVFILHPKDGVKYFPLRPTTFYDSTRKKQPNPYKTSYLVQIFLTHIMPHLYDKLKEYKSLSILTSYLHITVVYKIASLSSLQATTKLQQQSWRVQQADVNAGNSLPRFPEKSIPKKSEVRQKVLQHSTSPLHIIVQDHVDWL